MEFYDKNKENLEVYIKLGAKGHFPLFPVNLISNYLSEEKKIKLNTIEKIKARELFKKFCKYKSSKKQKVIIESLNVEDKKIFIKAFMKMIESDILDESPYLH